MNRTSADWPAPAKINRFLHVTGQRDDGYHDLQTLFQFVEPVDWLDFTLTDDGIIQREGGVDGLDADADLVVRAARALQPHSPGHLGVNIRLHKHIPVGGGLGGGSSDAATTLVALNKLWDCRLERAQLAQLGRGLGADVPVFIHGQAAWAEGIGDQLTPVVVDQPWLLLVDPGVAVATETIFCDAKLTHSQAHITIRAFEDGAVRNDCEPVVVRRYPEIGAELKRLAALGPTRLTGTGACLFARFATRRDAEQALAQWRGKGHAWVCQALNESPLVDRLKVEPDR